MITNTVFTPGEADSAALSRTLWITPELIDLSANSTASGIPQTQEDTGGSPTNPIFYGPPVS